MRSYVKSVRDEGQAANLPGLLSVGSMAYWKAPMQYC